VLSFIAWVEIKYAFLYCIGRSNVLSFIAWGDQMCFPLLQGRSNVLSFIAWGDQMGVSFGVKMEVKCD